MKNWPSSGWPTIRIDRTTPYQTVPKSKHTTRTRRRRGVCRVDGVEGPLVRFKMCRVDNVKGETVSRDVRRRADTG